MDHIITFSKNKLCFDDPLQALVNVWDEQEKCKRERAQLEASLYRSRLHGSGLTEDEQEEKDFRHYFPQFNQVLRLP